MARLLALLVGLLSVWTIDARKKQPHERSMTVVKRRMMHGRPLPDAPVEFVSMELLMDNTMPIDRSPMFTMPTGTSIATYIDPYDKNERERLNNLPLFSSGDRVRVAWRWTRPKQLKHVKVDIVRRSSIFRRWKRVSSLGSEVEVSTCSFDFDPRSHPPVLAAYPLQKIIRSPENLWCSIDVTMPKFSKRTNYYLRFTEFHVNQKGKIVRGARYILLQTQFRASRYWLDGIDNASRNLLDDVRYTKQTMKELIRRNHQRNIEAWSNGMNSMGDGIICTASFCYNTAKSAARGIGSGFMWVGGKISHIPPIPQINGAIDRFLHDSKKRVRKEQARVAALEVDQVRTNQRSDLLSDLETLVENLSSRA